TQTYKIIIEQLETFENIINKIPPQLNELNDPEDYRQWLDEINNKLDKNKTKIKNTLNSTNLTMAQFEGRVQEFEHDNQLKQSRRKLARWVLAIGLFTGLSTSLAPSIQNLGEAEMDPGVEELPTKPE
ncbi:MAG: hypothetical protein IKE41_03325, partial [Clostridia bacterium]|nr:hypothetical protein [Clostridia bacterium]